MGMSVPDLVIESIIRDGIENLKQRPELVDDVFSELTRAYASRKYGSAEIQRIKDYITGVNKKHIAVVHSFHEAAAKSPCFSIQLGSDNENKDHTYLDDFEDDERVALSQADLDALVVVSNFIPDSYDPLTGQVNVPDSDNLALVYSKFIYEDGSGTQFEIKSGISNDPGNKFFFIDTNQSPDIANPGEIKSFLTEEQFELRSTPNDTTIMIGCHSKEALFTKYLYILLKYFLRSRKLDLVSRCFDNPIIKGSDFTRDLQYQGDMVFTRFLTISGRTEDSWRSDQVDLIDSVETDPTPLGDPEDC